MRIGAIEHKVTQGDSTPQFLDKLEKSLSHSLDIVVGPDYSLSDDIPYDPVDRRNIIERLTELSSIYPNTLIIPGTMPWEMDDKEVALSCPVFLEGSIFKDLFKETDCDESKLAGSIKKSYYRGDSSLNYLRFRGKTIAIEICSDHGKQRIPNDTNLEIILANDLKAGFYLNAINCKPQRHILVCDSYSPKIEFFKLSKSLELIEGVKAEPYLDVFKVK